MIGATFLMSMMAPSLSKAAVFFLAVILAKVKLSSSDPCPGKSGLNVGYWGKAELCLTVHSITVYDKQARLSGFYWHGSNAHFTTTVIVYFGANVNFKTLVSENSEQKLILSSLVYIKMKCSPLQSN